MNQNRTKCVLGAVLVLSMMSVGLAQRTTETGTLNGTVSDKDNLSLPGVTVSASSPALMLPQISTVTDSQGYYRLPQLPVGLYKISFAISGFDTLVREEIKINLGMTTKLNITMEAAAIEKTVTVVGKAPTVDVETTSLGVVLDQRIIKNIPSNREFTNVFEMAPGVVSDGGRPSSHGATVRDNIFNLDGVSVSSPESGVYGSIQVGYEIAEEFQVQTGGHSAEYGGVRGSLINMITKSGGNQFSGEVNFYLRNKSLQSDNTAGTPLEGRFNGTNYDYDTTAQLGGPIIKDKLWFFANYSQTYSETFVSGYPYDKAENVPDDYGKKFPSLKLSYQISPAMKLVGSWNGWWSMRNNRSASMYRNEESTWKADFRSQTFNLAYSFQINDNMIFTARAASAIANLDYLAKNKLPSYYENDTRYYSGSMGNDNISERGRAQYLSNFTYFVDNFGGRHEFKTGIEYSSTWMNTKHVYNKDPRNGIGYLLYTNHGAAYRGRDYENYTSLSQFDSIGFFIQDRWNPTKKLTLNIGLRFDHQEAKVPAQGEERVPFVYKGVTYDARVREAFKPVIWNNISPRFGLSYDVTGDAKTAFKINYGRYYLQGLTSYIDSVNPNGDVIKYYNLNPDWSLASMYSFFATSATKIDPNLKTPYTDELIIGIERELFPNVSFSLNYIRKWDRDSIEDLIVEALDQEAIKEGRFVWSGYDPVTVSDPFNGSQITFYNQNSSLVAQSAYITNPEAAKRDYDGIEVVLERRFSDNWQLLASYIYSKSRGLIGTDYDESTGGSAFFNNPNSHTNALGRLPGERRHQFKLIGSYLAPFGISCSVYYRGFSGARYTRLVRSNDLGLNLVQGSVTIYAEERGSRGLPFVHQLDMRLEKEFRIKGAITLGIIADAFNILNSNTATGLESVSSSPSIVFGKIVGIVNPRIFKLGARVRF